VSRSIPDMRGLGPDLDLAAAGRGLGLTNCDWPPTSATTTAPSTPARYLLPTQALLKAREAARAHSPRMCGLVDVEEPVGASSR
jgi:hypothetical protein